MTDSERFAIDHTLSASLLLLAFLCAYVAIFGNPKLKAGLLGWMVSP